MQINAQNHGFDLYDDCCFLFVERLYHTDTNNHVYLICVGCLDALPSLPRSCDQAIK